MLSSRVKDRQRIVKDFLRAETFVSAPDRERPRVAILGPQPPGIGKTRETLHMQVRKGGGMLLSTSNGLAQEREVEAREIRQQDPKATGNPKRYVGLGRACLYLKKDDWSQRGWAMNDVACDGCPRKQECPAKKQFFRETPNEVALGVHQMTNWNKSGPIVLDEMPSPVNAITFSATELARLTSTFGWPRAISDWLEPIVEDFEALFRTLYYDADETAPANVSGETFLLTDLKPKYQRRCRRILMKLLAYFDTHSIPKPDPRAVRLGVITSDNWIHGDLHELLETMVEELDGRKQEEHRFGMSRAMCMRITTDADRTILSMDLELRHRWTPPTKPHIILDSTAQNSKKLYEQLYDGYDIKLMSRKADYDTKQIELIHYDTHAFAKRRAFGEDGKTLVKSGTNATVRALRETALQAAQIRQRTGFPVKVGIVGKRAMLEELGYRFDDENICDVRQGNLSAKDKTKPGRPENPRDKAMLHALQELERISDTVVGYHGNVTGSNKFASCRLFVVLGDNIPHIGAAQEDARILGMAAQEWIEARSRANGEQVVHRARLIDASPTNKKTVLYFGKFPPNLDGLTWKLGQWASGGRLPSQSYFEVQLRAVEFMARGQAIFGGLTPEIVTLHATPYLKALYIALRVTQAASDIASITPRESETYRRAIEDVACKFGYSRFERDNPMGERRPLIVWAKDSSAASALVSELSGRLRALPRDDQEVVVEQAVVRETRDTQIDEILVARGKLDVEVLEPAREMFAQLRMLEAECKRTDKVIHEKYRFRAMYHANSQEQNESRDAMKAASAALHQRYDEMKSQCDMLLKQLRATKHERQPILKAYDTRLKVVTSDTAGLSYVCEEVVVEDA